jgi:hypothetical protein
LQPPPPQTTLNNSNKQFQQQQPLAPQPNPSPVPPNQNVEPIKSIPKPQQPLSKIPMMIVPNSFADSDEIDIEAALMDIGDDANDDDLRDDPKMKPIPLLPATPIAKPLAFGGAKRAGMGGFSGTGLGLGGMAKQFGSGVCNPLKRVRANVNELQGNASSPKVPKMSTPTMTTATMTTAMTSTTITTPLQPPLAQNSIRNGISNSRNLNDVILPTAGSMPNLNPNLPNPNLPNLQEKVNDTNIVMDELGWDGDFNEPDEQLVKKFF